MKTLIISKKEMKDAMKIVKTVEKSELLIKGVSKQLKMKQKKQRAGFLGMLLGIFLIGY